MLTSAIRLLIDLRAKVSECPLWDGERRKLHVIDIYKHEILTYDWATGRTDSVTVGQTVGSIGLARDGKVVAALQSSLALVDLATGQQQELATIQHAQPESRLNDGRCDPAGRFWVGSMREALDRPAGALYRVDPDGAVHRQADDIVCSNGLGFSPDGRTMYHADSRRSTVWRYEYDVTTGAATNRRVFCVAPDGEGRPDGAAVDVEGCYWIARYAGGRIVRYGPDGRALFTLTVPVANPTMCTFAGDDLKTLVITSARGDAPPSDNDGHAGSVFAVEVAVPGLKEPRFGA